MSSTPTDRAPRRRHPLRRRAALVAPLVAIAVLAAGCGGKDKLEGTLVKDALGCQPTDVDRQTDEPTVEAGTKVGKEVGKKDLTKGKGCTADTENYLTLDMVGATAKDGKVFVSTFGDGHPISAKLGAGTLVAGLEAGIDGMKVGGRRQITVPAAQAYGKEGNEAQGIGKDADLVFVVDLVGVTIAPLYCSELRDYPVELDGKAIPGKPKPEDIQMPLEVPTTKVDTRDIKKGSGSKIGKSAWVTVKYAGISCVSGNQFDSSWDRYADGDDTIKVALGGAEPTADYSGVIPGWSSGLESASKGTVRQMNIPYQLAYGAQGGGAEIAPYASLVFIVEVVDVTHQKPKTTTTTTPATTTSAPAGDTTTTAAEGETTTTAGDGETTTTAADGDTTTTAAQTGTSQD